MSVWNCRHGRQLCHCAICAPEAEERMRSRAPMPDDSTGEEMAEQLDDDETLQGLCATYRARFDKAEALVRDCANMLAEGIEGRTDKGEAYSNVFVKLYGFCFGPDAAIQILAEGKRI